MRSIRTLVLRLVREIPQWVPAGAREMLTLGVKVAASTIWQILREADIDPATTT